MSLTNFLVPIECHDVLQVRETFALALSDAFRELAR